MIFELLIDGACMECLMVRGWLRVHSLARVLRTSGHGVEMDKARPVAGITTFLHHRNSPYQVPYEDGLRIEPESSPSHRVW